jgi:hypothetical protein
VTTVVRKTILARILFPSAVPREPGSRSVPSDPNYRSGWIKVNNFAGANDALVEPLSPQGEDSLDVWSEKQFFGHATNADDDGAFAHFYAAHS